MSECIDKTVFLTSVSLTLSQNPTWLADVISAISSGMEDARIKACEERNKP